MEWWVFGSLRFICAPISSNPRLNHRIERNKNGTKRERDGQLEQGVINQASNFLKFRSDLWCMDFTISKLMWRERERESFSIKSSNFFLVELEHFEEIKCKVINNKLENKMIKLICCGC